MEEAIYINDFRHNAPLITGFISSLHKFSNFKFSRIQKKGDIIKITVGKNCVFNRDIIKSHKLTCVVEDELFITVYENGDRVFWKTTNT